jgi:hypothetical protein
VSHIVVQFWQVSEAPAYRFLVTQTYFMSFWRWLAASAAEFGAETAAAAALHERPALAVFAATRRCL